MADNGTDREDDVSGKPSTCTICPVFLQNRLSVPKNRSLILKLASQSFKVFSVPLSVRSVITHEKHALGIEPMTMLIPISGQPAVLAGIS